jgi:hypothetical protein
MGRVPFARSAMIARFFGKLAALLCRRQAACCQANWSIRVP